MVVAFRHYHRLIPRGAPAFSWSNPFVASCASLRDWVRDHLTFDNAGLVSVFETTIRVLGGLLSAFELSRDQVGNGAFLTSPIDQTLS